MFCLIPATIFEQIEPLEAECKTMSDIIKLLNDTLDCEGNWVPSQLENP